MASDWSSGFVRTFSIRLAMVVVALLAGAADARADVTAFLGVSAPSTGFAQGFSFGGGRPPVLFEIEYARSVNGPREATPSLYTGSINLLIQPDVPVRGMLIYGIGGVGAYGEAFGSGVGGGVDTCTNVGGGVKVALAGPLRVRLDYRVFLLHGMPKDKRPQRLYAGLSLGF